MTVTIAPPETVVLAPDLELSLPTQPARLLGRLAEVARAVGWALVGVTVVIVLWQVAAARVADLPAPSETLSKLLKLSGDAFASDGTSKGIGLQLLSSLQRVLWGFGLATLVGVPLGLLVGGSRRAWQAANPVIQILRPVSPLAWFPIWLVVFKDAPRAAVWVIFITSLWPTVINTAAGAASVPIDHRNVAKVFRFTRLAYVRHVMVPHTLPSMVTGLRLSMGVAWMVIVAVEMLSGGVGIGFFVWDAYNALDLAKVISAIVLIGLVGVLLDLCFLWLGRRVAIEEVAL